MYGDNLPDGVDMVFNTNKPKGTPFLGSKDNTVAKAIKDDPDLPFGSIVRQKHYTDKSGKEKLSPLNIVGENEEGRWGEWSKTLSSQMLSKQSPALAKQQLGIAFDAKKSEFDEIMSLSNPTVKQKLLEEFADGADSSAKHLKAAGLPRTRQHVILPINSLKDNEIYAPNYRQGETVVLIRHPHGGKFEIPELKVNNRNVEANRVIKNAKDAVGINSKVAARLSGADFDGDTVLVIPNGGAGLKVKNQAPLTGLKNFDPQTRYPGYEGMPVMSTKAKGKQMGDVSNLITDMTIKGASDSEIARAVRHSMVVIDAEKHKLNYKLSAQENGIAELKKKYQSEDGTNAKAGAATLISRAKSPAYVNERIPRPAALGGPIDKATGKKVFVETNAEYNKVDPVTGSSKVVVKKTKVPKMDLVEDAHILSSGTDMERVYGDHANKLKSLANDARKEAINITPRKVSPSAKVTYSEEVKTLKSKLNIAKMNAPLERQAQLGAAAIVALKKETHPDLDASEIKKIRSQALTESRARVGAKKETIVFTPREWEAVQNGAISTNILKSILNNADMDQVRQLATPRDNPVMSDAKIRRAKAMTALGYTQAEVADALGVPTSTLASAIK
jgi:hypothetical protein